MCLSAEKRNFLLLLQIKKVYIGLTMWVPRPEPDPEPYCQLNYVKAKF